MTATLEIPTTKKPSPPVVALSRVRKEHGRGEGSVLALDGVDLQVEPGEFVCVLGGSGCGKSTLLNLIAGLDQPTAGTITLNASRPALMFQEAALMPWLTALRNVELPLRLVGMQRSERRATARELLQLVRLDDMSDKHPHQLSGGMRQRVALARALASTLGSTEEGVPGLMLMDEPFAALDAITRDVLQAELREVWKRTHVAIVFVTHDVREAVRMSQRVVLMSSRPGQVVAEWQVDNVSGSEEAGAIDEITDRLRKEIRSHAPTATA